MKDLNHQNINTFIGACVDPGNICILTQYCNKGSLQVKKKIPINYMYLSDPTVFWGLK